MDDEDPMGKSKFTAEQIAYCFTQAEAGEPLPEPCRKHGISTTIFYCRLNSNWYRDLDDANRPIEAWRLDYYEVRPHPRFGQMPPATFVASSSG